MTAQPSAPLPEITLFNSQGRTLEPLRPLSPGELKIYCCGPTVYNFQHIGNLRTYIFEDLLVRTLRYAGYKVTHVMNITDVGHLVSDADEGEDKMLVATRREGKTSAEIAGYYTDIFFDHCGWLNIRRPDVVCKATEHIPQMIALIQRLEARGAAYVSGGNVYFNVGTDEDYGKLAALDLESLKAGARIEVDSNKKHPLDFALWFTKSKFENQELQWDSPWGRGYPGWHIECSAMSMHYLGEHFDIHCGGIDHIPVHHTNEIAQSETATGCTFANTWMHGGFLVVNKDKMSKSTGEFLTLDRVKERGLEPMSYRLLCLSGSYRNELSWSWLALESAANTLKKIQSAVVSWREQLGSTSPALPTPEELSAPAQELRARFRAEVFADLGMPKALAVLHEVLGSQQLPVQERLVLLLDFDRVFGLGVADWQPDTEEIPADVEALAEERASARQSKNWKRSDELRDELLARGYVVEDSKSGQRLKKRS